MAFKIRLRRIHKTLEVSPDSLNNDLDSNNQWVQSLIACMRWCWPMRLATSLAEMTSVVSSTMTSSSSSSDWSSSSPLLLETNEDPPALLYEDRREEKDRLLLDNLELSDPEEPLLPLGSASSSLLSSLVELLVSLLFSDSSELLLERRRRRLKRCGRPWLNDQALFFKITSRLNQAFCRLGMTMS